MQVFKVIGSVTLNRCHPSFIGARLLATEPMGGEAIGGPATKDPDLVIVWDDLGAGIGAKIAVADGAEAAQPFKPNMKAVDAYCSAILDTIHIDAEAIKRLKT
jgi:microcompartment protein CcmK/EutM